MNLHDFPERRSEPCPEEILEIVETVRPILAGRDPSVMGGALAELVAMFFAGHHPSYRQTMFADWLKLTRSLIKLNASEMIKKMGGIENWPRERK